MFLVTLKELCGVVAFVAVVFVLLAAWRANRRKSGPDASGLVLLALEESGPARSAIVGVFVDRQTKGRVYLSRVEIERALRELESMGFVKSHERYDRTRRDSVGKMLADARGESAVLIYELTDAGRHFLADTKGAPR